MQLQSEEAKTNYLQESLNSQGICFSNTTAYATDEYIVHYATVKQEQESYP